MPSYFYTARSLEGEAQTGTQLAEDERQLAQDLKAKGLLLISAVPEEKKRGWSLHFSLGQKVKASATEKIMLTRNLEVMVSTGLSLVKSFDILAGQEKSKPVKKALQEVMANINKGENLSDAMAKFPGVFSELFCNMVKIGEESGTLDEVLQALSLQISKEHELKSKIRNAMIYPAIILLVMMVVGIVMVTIVLPSLKVFFTSLNVDIPIYTRILLAGGDFFTAYWYWVLLAVILFAGALFAGWKTKQGHAAVDTLMLRMPLIAPIVKKNNSALLVRSLSSLISAGVPLVRALEISSKTVGNHYFRDALMQAGEKIRKGDKLSSSLKGYHDIFPFGVIEMMEVGEETGKTSVILKKLADFYEEEAVRAIEKLVTLLEPLMIIFLGLAVGVFAFSMIQPMYSSLQGIH